MKQLAAIVLFVMTSSLSWRSLAGQARSASELTLVGQGRVSAIYDIEAVPPYAYALESGILRVLDVRNPRAVAEVGTLAFKRARSRAALRFPYLYLTGFAAPLAVVDISSPTRPRWVADCTELAGANGDVFELATDRAYLVSQEGPPGAPAPLFLDVLDLSGQPGCPRKLGRVALGVSLIKGYEFGGIAQANGRAFVMVHRPPGVGNRSRLVIVDATTAGAPRIVRTVLLPEGKRYNDIEVRGDLVFLLESTPQKPNGLAIYRLRADSELELVGEALSPDIFFPIDLIVHNDAVYATYKGGALLVTFDISRPERPTIADRYQQTDRWSAGLGMALVGNRLYVTGDGGPAPIFDVSVAHSPRLLGRWEYDGGAVDDVIVDGTRAVLRSMGGDLFFYDVSKPASPKRVGIYRGALLGKTSEWQWNFVATVRGPRALVAYETLPAELLDISRPNQPAVLGAFTPRGLVNAIVLTATHAFLGHRAPADGKTPRTTDPSSVSERGGIESVDLRDPRRPRVIGHLDMAVAVSDLARHDNRLIAVHADGSLTVVDTRDPSQPVVLGRLAGVTASSELLVARPARVVLSADGGLAYVSHTDAASRTGTLTVVDIHDPSLPRKVGQLNLEQTGSSEPSLAVEGTRVAVLLGGTDLLIVEAGNPAQLTSVRHALSPHTFAQGLAFVNGSVFVGAGEDGVLIYRLPPASKAP